MAETQYVIVLTDKELQEIVTLCGMAIKQKVLLPGVRPKIISGMRKMYETYNGDGAEDFDAVLAKLKEL